MIVNDYCDFYFFNRKDNSFYNLIYLMWLIFNNAKDELYRNYTLRLDFK
jgi:hypothetical protein